MMHPIQKVRYHAFWRGKAMKIATPIDYADVQHTANALCCHIAFGDGDPRPAARQAGVMLAAARRHSRHLRAKRRWKND